MIRHPTTRSSNWFAVGCWAAFFLLLGGIAQPGLLFVAALVIWPLVTYARRHWRTWEPEPAPSPAPTPQGLPRQNRPKPAAKPSAVVVSRPRAPPIHHEPSGPIIHLPPPGAVILGPFCRECRKPMSGSVGRAISCGDCRWGVRWENGTKQEYTWTKPRDTRYAESRDYGIAVIEAKAKPRGNKAWIHCPRCTQKTMFVTLVQVRGRKSPPDEVYECDSCGHRTRNRP